MAFIPTIGLEIHAQLNTRTKMFCGSLNDPDEQRPNTNICPVCMGHPGTLPVANKAAVEKVVQVGLALGCTIRERSWFERKNYFYPDLPKGYQISQYEAPLCEAGELEIHPKEGGLKKIRVRRVHLEEDTGRLMHDTKKGVSLVDFNRAGVPLMELVTEPDIETAAEARAFGEELRLLFRYLDVSGADMEKGQMRLEANVSLRAEGDDTLGTKVELKNINSFRALERAIEYEITRQEKVLSSGESIRHETRGWDDARGVTFAQRTKEESEEYRYFPEPDLPPVVLQKEAITAIQEKLPELPRARRYRFEQEYALSPVHARTLTHNQELGNYFESVVSELRVWMKNEDIDGKDTEAALITLSANYLTTELQKLITESATATEDIKITAEDFAELIVMIHKKTISSSAAQDILAEMFNTGGDPHHILKEKDLTQVSDEDALEEVARRVIASHPDAVSDYTAGKEEAITFLVGQMMRETKGRANPKIAADIITKLLKK